jgi:hypothetical protein
MVWLDVVRDNAWLIVIAIGLFIYEGGLHKTLREVERKNRELEEHRAEHKRQWEIANPELAAKGVPNPPCRTCIMQYVARI